MVDVGREEEKREVEDGQRRDELEVSDKEEKLGRVHE